MATLREFVLNAKPNVKLVRTPNHFVLHVILTDSSSLISHRV